MKKYMTERDLKQYDETSRFEGIVFAIVISLAAIGLAIGMFGCTGAQAVPGATCTFTFAKQDGTRVQFTSDKDTSADSVRFDPVTGQIEIVKLNSNGSNLAPAQMLAFIQQSNNATIIAQAVSNAVVQALGRGQGAAIIVPTVPTTMPSR